MISPESYLSKLLKPEMESITISGEEYSLMEAVSIPRGDLEETLYEHAERTVAWRRILTKCRESYHTAVDRFEEMKHQRFIQYWRTLEDREREEMSKHLHDEDAPRDMFKRKQFVKNRISAGVSTHSRGRWRRNFSDDLVWAFVHNDEEVVAKRKKMRRLKREMDAVEAVVEALDHRARCISHLCARNRT